MDTRYFGNNLLAYRQVHEDRRGLSNGSGEDAYYQCHTPAGGRMSRIASAAAVLFSLVTVGLWLH